MTSPRSADPRGSSTTRLARRLGMFDAVVIGLASMIGAGIFAAIGPAAAAASGGLLIGLVIAGIVAYCNASSSAQLAALYPRSGGAYVYGRERLGETWGFMAGWGFVIGKIASCAAMALTFGAYAYPRYGRLLALGAVVVLTAVNVYGVRATARVAAAIATVVLTSLAVAVVSIHAGEADWARIGSPADAGAIGILQASGFLFFAFAGYARIATLGEEVRDPGRTIPRAIIVALVITLVVYAVVIASALAAVGPEALARSTAPLATAVEASGSRWATSVTRVGAIVASLGVLLALLAGIARTSFAMASEHDLPRWLAAVHPRTRTPYRSEIVIGLVVCALVALTDLREAIGFSSFAILMYYGLTNAAAITLSREERRFPHAVAFVGLAGCLVLAFTLPLTSVIVASVILVIGIAARAGVRLATGDRRRRKRLNGR